MGSNPTHDDLYSIQHYVIKFVSDLWKVGGLGTLDIVILFAKCLLLRLCYFYLGGGRLGLSPIHGKMKTSNIHILLHIKRTFSNTRFDQI